MRALRTKAQPASLLGPDSIEVHTRKLRVGEGWCETFVVTGFPREVGPGWLAPLLSYPGAADISLHVEPVPNQIAAVKLRRQLARLESTRRIDSAKARLSDPELETAALDAADLAAGIARGEGRLFRLGVYLTVRARCLEELEAQSHKVKAIASSLLLDARPVPFRAFDGWVSTLPLAVDPLKLRRTFDTKALASCFPFGGAELNHDDGILYGRNVDTGSLIFCDRFGLENHNQVILARSGAGKSYLAKLLLLRSLFDGVEALVIDPENEYEPLANAVGGSVFRLGSPGQRLNPFDLERSNETDAVLHQSLFIHTMVRALIGEVTSEQKALLDSAILATYERFGITADASTHVRQAPLLGDLATTLAENASTHTLAKRLEPFARGSHRALFDGPTTGEAKSHLVIFSLRDLPEELKSAATLIALDAVWKRVTGPERKRRIVVVDEAWWLLRSGHEYAAAFLQRLAKSARKNWCGLTTITQDVSDVLSTDLGQAVITNASSHVLLGQSPQAIPSLREVFNLSAGEASFLTSCDRGVGLLSIGQERAPLKVISSHREHALMTTSPESDAKDVAE